MPADISLAYLDQPLNNLSVAYQNAEFVAPKLFPFVPVSDRSGRYWVFGFEKFREYETARAPGVKANRIAPWSLSNSPYFCDGHAMSDVIPDEHRRAASPGAQLEVTTLENMLNAIALKFEIRAKALIDGTAIPAPSPAVPSTTLSGTSQWSDFTNSDPVAEVETRRATIEKAVSQVPNTLLVSYPVHLKLRRHPRIIELFKPQMRTGFPTNEQLASLFEVDNYWIARAKKNTAKEGQTKSLDYVWAKDALLAYVPPAIGQRIVALGAAFRWVFGAPELGGMLTKRYRDESISSDVVEVQTYYDPQLVATDAGFYWINAIA